MRAFIYDLLITDEDTAAEIPILVEDLVKRVTPRRAQENVTYDDLPRPFILYGLGNSTHEQLSDSTANDSQVDRQFFQVWIHDEGGDFDLIDRMVSTVIKRLRGQGSKEHGIYTIEYLETSSEFNNETYNTNFRYIRFQAIKVKVGAPA